MSINRSWPVSSTPSLAARGLNACLDVRCTEYGLIISISYLLTSYLTYLLCGKSYPFTCKSTYGGGGYNAVRGDVHSVQDINAWVRVEKARVCL